jgi:hypothetical protein
LGSAHLPMALADSPLSSFTLMQLLASVSYEMLLRADVMQTFMVYALVDVFFMAKTKYLVTPTT